MYRLLFLMILMVTMPYLVFAVILSVKQDGSGDYTAIQTALDAANPGDTVLVYPGRYFENLSIQTNNIALMSLEGTTGNSGYIDSTIIDGTQSLGGIFVNQYKTGILIRGFSITKGIGAGVSLLASSESTVSNCKIFGRTSTFGGGVNVGGATVYLSGVDIFDNYALQLGGGLYASAPTGHITNITFDPVNRCSIYDNRAGSGQDIYIQRATSDLELPLDTFSVPDPSDYYAFYLSDNLTIHNYQINFDILNAHHQEIDSDLYVSTTGNDADDGLSPATALKTIHEAIYRIAADSLNQNTVHVLPGEYSRTDNDQIFPIALKSWTIVQGSGINITTVICEPHPDIPLVYGTADVTFASFTESVNTIQDISITSRFSNNSNAILLYRLGCLNLTNVRIHDLVVDYIPAIMGAMHNAHESIWENVTIENINSSLSGLVSMSVSDSPTGHMTAMSGKISNCTFRNATSTFMSSSVWGPSLVSFAADKRLEFENCVFDNLIVYDDDTFAVSLGSVQYPQQQNHFSFKNCLFSNISTQNDMIAIGSKNNPRIDVTNCTFSGNQGNAYTLMVNGEVNIVNSIFDNDTPYQIKVNPMNYIMAEHTHLTIDHSCIKDGINGILPFPVPGNTITFLPSSISSSPLFAGGDDIHDPFYYSLSEYSPCINSGSPELTDLGLPPYDLAGNYRVWNNRIDMGCFEFGSPPWVTNIDDPVVPSIPETSITAYPNPFSAFTNIKISLQNQSHISRINDARVKVYNLKGQLVKSIALDPFNMDNQIVQWDSRDTEGRVCANGIYFLKLQINGIDKGSKKLSLIK